MVWYGTHGMVWYGYGHTLFTVSEGEIERYGALELVYTMMVTATGWHQPDLI